MNNYTTTPRQRKILIIAAISFFAIILFIALYAFIRNPYGEEIVVRDLSSYMNESKPDSDTLASVQHNLFTTLQRNNTKNITNRSVKDVLVREKSFKQSFDEKTSIHNVYFIADIPSLQQSYGINIQWTTEGEVNQIDQYGIDISCLPRDQLIMDEFHCEDLASDMAGTTGPYILIDWSGVKDSYGNSVESQIQPYEMRFIEHQILGDYDKNNTLFRKDVSAKIEDSVKRDVLNGNNSLLFNVIVEGGGRYEVFIDFNDGRYNSITNTSTNLLVERRTELL